MSTSSEANPSTDSRRKPGEAEPEPGDGTDNDVGSSTAVAVDDEQQHSWPDAVVPRTIKAGPDLEIVPDREPEIDTGAAPDDAATTAGDNDQNAGTGRQDHTRLDGLGKVDRPAADSENGDPVDPTATNVLVNQGRPAAVALARFLVGRIDREEAARHIAEYQRPLLWMWRRAVGMAFAYILVSVTWFLVKLPSSLVADATIPSQVQVAAAFHELRIDGLAGATLGAHAGSSLFRFATGLGIGAALGIAIGIITGSAPLVRTIVDPIASFFRLVPGLAAGPLLLVWFGVGEAGLIAVVAFSVMWATIVSASDERTVTVRGGRASGSAPDSTTIDAVFASVRSAVLVAWTTMLAIETVVASTGLGAMIWFAQGRSDMVLAGILVVGLIGFAIDTSLRLTHYLITHDVVTTTGS